jgi:diacylglycerol O-acyltransferase-1
MSSINKNGADDGTFTASPSTKSSTSTGVTKAIDVLMQQNADLEREVGRLMAEIDEVTKGIVKRGYLYKYRDREISYASKWALRYFTLQGKILSYYNDERDTRPRRTIDLSKCVVKEEGTKKGGQYHVFGIYLGTSDAEGSGALLMRLSSEISAEAMQWVDMLEQGCAMEDENFQEYITSSNFNDNILLSKIGDDNNEVVIDKDKDGWTNHIDPAADEIVDSNDPNLSRALVRVKSSTLVLQRSLSRQTMARKVLSIRSPTNFSSSGTRLSQAVSSPKNKSKNGNIVGRSFPGSKPVHLSINNSPLSSEAKPSEQNYRGFFNLGVMILFISNFRMIIDNLAKHGLLISFPGLPNISNVKEIEETINYWEPARPLQGFLSWIGSVLITYTIEKMAARGLISDLNVLILHFVFGTLNIVLPTYWVWTSKSSPGSSMIFLFQAVIIWLKLISYAHANRDLRKTYRKQKELSAQESKNDSGENSPIPVSISTSNMLSSTITFDTNGKPSISNLFAELKDLEQPYLTYPFNVTLPNLLYFMIVPTLCYQLNYPRSPRIRWRYVLTLILRMFLVAGLIIFTVAQYLQPTLEQSLLSMHTLNVVEVAERLLKLSIPNTYVWLLGFYFYFHLWLNLFAELTRFGDRLFYKDWWNSRTIESYWRNWNIPVHNWMLRHLYHPLIRLKVPKYVGMICCFLLSAVLHELIISTPFHYYTLHAFFGMILQAPLIFITTKIDRIFDNQFVGNAIFWLVFCILGQPMGILMYYYDLYKETLK